MKVQTNSKSEPKSPKRDESKLFYFLIHEREELVLIRPKSESDYQGRDSSNKSKNRTVKEREGHDEKLSDLKPSIFYLFFCKIISMCSLFFMP